jgi:hypothetical protein
VKSGFSCEGGAGVLGLDLSLIAREINLSLNQW